MEEKLAVTPKSGRINFGDPWFEMDIPVSTGIDNMSFRMGKLLIESYYNGFLSAQEGFEHYIALYSWGDIDVQTQTIHLSAFAAELIEPLRVGAKVKAQMLNGLAPIIVSRENADQLQVTTRLKTDWLRREYHASVYVDTDEDGVLDTAQQQPPAPKSAPPPSL